MYEVILTHPQPRADKKPRPSLQFGDFAHEVIHSEPHLDLNLVQGLQIARAYQPDQFGQPLGVPSICLQSLLENLVENVSVDLGRVRGARRLDSVLQHSAPRAGERVCHDGGGYEMVWVEDQEVFGVVDHALAELVEATQDVDEGAVGARTVEPGVS